ncbi:MAG: polymorphic toxin type 44 domain-containing protein [Chromatiaceae bacterium]
MNEGPYGTSGLCTETQYDMTAWLVSEMVSNVNGTEMAAMEAVLDQPQPINMSGPFVIVVDTRYLQMLIGPFYQLNKTYGLWDFKQKMEDLGGGVILCGSSECVWVDYSTPGNIHYGYIAAAIGVPKQLSQGAGGFLEVSSPTGEPGGVSTLFENPEDWAGVDFGYQLYDSFGDDMTLAEFQSALTTDVSEGLQRPPSTFEPPWPAKPQENHYPLGFFDYE